MKAQSIADVSSGRDNLFDLLRFVLASFVVYSHCFALLYEGTPQAYDPLLRGTNGQAAFGGLAVDGFFLISGFLITKSWLQSKSVLNYTERRILRIIPALVAVLIVSVFIFGPISTNLPLRLYFSEPRTYAYFGMMGTINLHLTDQLPGVFAHNPLKWRVNGSLWTIRCEAICYFLVVILGLTQVLKRRLLVLLASIAGIAFFALKGHHNISGNEFSDSIRVLMYFLWGTTFFLYRDRIPHSLPMIAVVVLAIVTSYLLGILSLTTPILGGYALFYIAFKPVFGLENFARHGDFSYGLYLYAFPIQQILISRFPSCWNPATLFAATLVATLACAVLSWHFVEKPFMKMKWKVSRNTEPQTIAMKTQTEQPNTQIVEAAK